MEPLEMDLELEPEETRPPQPSFIDVPDKSNMFASFFYCILAFFTFPFLLSLIGGLMEWEGVKALSWLDVIYHVINWLFAVCIYASYLRDARDLLFVDKKVVKTGAITVGLAVLYCIVLIGAGIRLQDSALLFGAAGALPISEMDVMVLGSTLAIENPIFGTLSLVLLAPMTISCLFYVTAFAPAYNVKPWLGYLAVAAFTAFPGVCMVFNHWPVQQEVMLYLGRLPIHLLACWSFRRTETIFVPMVVLGASNLVSCLYYIFMFGPL